METIASTVLINLREWAPLTDLLGKIPAKVQRGLFYHDLSMTCADVLADFIALGTDAGIVLWYNRTNGDLQKLRCEVSIWGTPDRFNHNRISMSHRIEIVVIIAQQQKFI